MLSNDVGVVWSMAPGPMDRVGRDHRTAGGRRRRSFAAPLPLTSFQDDVAALERALERVPGPLVLAGHAYAGAVIAAARSEKVKALVYIAALAPDEGETVADVFYRAEPHPQAPKLASDEHGLIYLPARLLPPPLRRMPAPRTWRCWKRFSGRSRPPASPSRYLGRCGRTVRPGSWWPSRIA